MFSLKPTAREGHPHSWRTTAALLLALILLVTACSPASPPPQPTQPTLQLENCLLTQPGSGQFKAECGMLEVPEDPDNPQGPTISLKVAVVRAVSRAPAPDPLFLLAGGPGQAASESFPALLFSLDRLHFKRDLVMVDQRGTGASRPLICDNFDEEPDVIGEELPLEEQIALLEECRAELGINPLLYTTAVAARDLDAVRQALGYETINLLGVSYGTRAALEYQRQFPERARSLILDGVVPPDWPLGARIGVDAQRALDLVFARCQASPACRERYPNLERDFDEVFAQVAASPVTVTVIHPRSGEPVDVLIDDQILAGTVRLMSYSDILTALLPLVIDSAAQGSYERLASHYLTLAGELEHSLSVGMYYSVVCAEDAPFLPEAAPQEKAFLDPRLDLMRAACQVWLPEPPAEAPPGPPASDVPVLLISGEADPVTPPANGEVVAALLPNSRHIVLPGLGHNNFYAGCMPGLLYEFVETLDPRALDTTCTQTIQPQPFFLSPLAPEP